MSGGSWFCLARPCRSAARIHPVPGFIDDDLGLRVVCNEPERSIAKDKVISGGSWLSGPWGCRSAARSLYGPGFAFDDLVGFRVVCWEAKS